MSGYAKPLYMLPFDHRAFFLRELWGDRPVGENEHALLQKYKQVIYAGFLEALTQGVPKECAAVLVDEEYGLSIIKDALARGLTTAVSTEKSGSATFEFAYGEDFRKHLLYIRPTFAKALLCKGETLFETQREEEIKRLKDLSDFCREERIYFLLEILTEVSLEKRSETVASLVVQCQQYGIEPDVWKLEALREESGYRQIVSSARAGGRDSVGIIILGRGENLPEALHTLSVAKNVPGISGFAIGRSVFWEAVKSLHLGSIRETEAKEKITKNFLHSYRVFTGIDF